MTAATSDGIKIDRDVVSRLEKLGLSPRQAEIMYLVFESTRRTGVQPSIRELMERFGMTGPNGIVCHTKALVRKGWIEPSTNQSRALRFLRCPPDGRRFTGFVLPE